jgi:hypothetical protein
MASKKSTRRRSGKTPDCVQVREKDANRRQSIETRVSAPREGFVEDSTRNSDQQIGLRLSMRHLREQLDSIASELELIAQTADFVQHHAPERASEQQANTRGIPELADPNTGALAEAEALAEVLEVVPTAEAGGWVFSNTTVPAIARMLSDRLCQIRGAVTQRGAA